MGKIQKILDKNSAEVYPITHERAVKDSNGVTLETKLGQLDLKVDENNGLNRIPVNIPGNNNTLVSQRVYGLLSGKKYRVKIVNPSVPVSNIPASMSVRFKMSYIFIGSGTPVSLVDIKCNSLSTPLADYYDITIPDTGELDYLLFEIRCNSGSTLQMYINEDTSDVATKTELEEVAGKYESHSEWLYVILDSDKRILGGFREDGSIDWVLGVPQPIKDYIAEQFQGVESEVKSPEWMQVITDNDGNVLYGVKEDGSFDWTMGIPLPIKNELTKIYDILKVDEDGLPVLPDYYFENDYLDSKILEINNEIRKCAINGDAFFWITDPHWDHYNQRLSPSLIKYIRKKTGITRLLCGGDISDGHDGLNQHYLWHDTECMLDFFGKTRAAIGSNMVYATYGNHDFFGETDYDSIFYEYGLFRENVVYADEYKTAYYIDNAPQKMRYIALGEWGLSNSGYEDLLTASVKTWFANVALNVQSGWTVVIFIHGLFTNQQGTNTLIPYIDPNTGTWAVSGGSIIQPIGGCTDIIDTIDNYKANGGLGDIACVLMGHWHADRIHIGRVISPATTGVPYIISQSDQFHDSFVGGISDIKAPRTLGTITEQHFEVVVVNKDDRTVKLFAIGSLARDGIDNNVGNLVEVRTVNY